MKMASSPYLGENILQFFLNMCVAELKDSQSGEDKFKSSLISLNSNLSSGIVQKSLNYGAPYNRAAYMYKFQPCIAWTAYSYIQRAMVECPEVSSMITKLLNSSDLKLCCIGAGAGADFIGFLLGISSGTIKAAIKSVTIIPETAEWRCTIIRYIETLKTGTLNPVHRFILGKKMVSTVLGCDFLKRPNSKVANKIKEANVFLVDKVFPAVAPEVQGLEVTLANIMSLMKPGSLVFFIDHSAGFNVMLRTAHCTNQQILFGPLREQYRLPQLPEIFKTTYSCYPQISSRTYFMVWKKTSNNVSATLEDSNVFSPFPSLSLKSGCTPGSSVISSGVLASTSCESSALLPQKKHSETGSVSKVPPKSICNNSVAASYSEKLKSESTSTVTLVTPCKSVTAADSATCDTVSEKKDVPSAKGLKSNENGSSSSVLDSHEITKTQTMRVSNSRPVISIENFADLLTYRILADARLELIHKALLRKDKSVEEFLYGQPTSGGSSYMSNLYAYHETEPLASFQVSCDSRNAEYQTDYSFAQETLSVGSRCFHTSTPHVVSESVNCFPKTKKEENCEYWDEQFQLDKFSQTEENKNELPSTIQSRLAELTQRVNRLSSIVEELILSQSKEHSCCCSAASAPLSDMCCGTQGKFPYLVLPVENLNDNPMLLSLLMCQSENTKS